MAPSMQPIAGILNNLAEHKGALEGPSSWGAVYSCIEAEDRYVGCTDQGARGGDFKQQQHQ